MTQYEAEKKFDQFKEIAVENLVGWLDIDEDNPIVENAAKKIAAAVVCAFGEMDNARREELKKMEAEFLSGGENKDGRATSVKELADKVADFQLKHAESDSDDYAYEASRFISDLHTELTNLISNSSR